MIGPIPRLCPQPGPKAQRTRVSEASVIARPPTLQPKKPHRRPWPSNPWAQAGPKSKSCARWHGPSRPSPLHPCKQPASLSQGSRKPPVVLGQRDLPFYSQTPAHILDSPDPKIPSVRMVKGESPRRRAENWPPRDVIRKQTVKKPMPRTKSLWGGQSRSAGQASDSAPSLHRGRHRNAKVMHKEGSQGQREVGRQWG